MNFIFSCIREEFSRMQKPAMKITAQFGLAMLAVAFAAAASGAQSTGDPAVEFRKISGELSEARQSGADEGQAGMEKALAYLDSIAIETANGAPAADLDAANRHLAALASHTPPIGENYRLVKLGGAPPAYAMVVNFGLGGPAAVRVYAANSSGRYALAAKIDHFAQKDFFDSDVELVAVSASEPVFLTVSGRTDDLATGQFSAWKFDGGHLVALWSSDLLQQSSYESDDNGFHLAYCSQEDDDHPSDCLKMSRDVYRYENGEWKRTETVEMPPSKPSAK